ncbi:Dickkopf- protein 2 [Dissostichus eleginoides]|nr:Dickkopf- protein 2 [Dissostichus eleginoides]
MCKQQCRAQIIASLKTGTSQVSEARPKANLIMPALSEESPTPATNRTAHTGITKKHNALAQGNRQRGGIHAFFFKAAALHQHEGSTRQGRGLPLSVSAFIVPPAYQERLQSTPFSSHFLSRIQGCAFMSAYVYPCSNDKECSVGSYCHSPQQSPPRCLNCRRRKKRCHRDAMCCPGNRCSNFICVPISESVLSPHISALDEDNKLSTKDQSWRKNGNLHAKHSLKGHEGDPCLRSSDCSEGYCCARHFWTKICKPVLRQGEVCTKQRKKGTHGLEIFQRCDCAKGLSCKVWKDATSSSKSRLHMCQKI